MKDMRKKRISMALAAAFAGVGASTQVWASNLSQVALGDLVLFPYYTVRSAPGGLAGNQWVTDISVINTSASTIVAKVRFHEGHNSREVLDFNVVLSPHDYLNFWAYDTPTGPKIGFPPEDSTCIVPVPPDRANKVNGGGGNLSFLNYAYANFEDGVNEADQDGDGVTDTVNGVKLVQGDINRAREGYFTIIEMGSSDPGNEDNTAFEVPYYAKHGHQDCTKVEARFSSQGDPAPILDTYADFERNLNALKGMYALTNFVQGIQGAGSGVHIANFATWNSVIAHTPTSFAIGAADVKAKSKAKNDIWEDTGFGLKDNDRLDKGEGTLADAAAVALKTAIQNCPGTIATFQSAFTMPSGAHFCTVPMTPSAKMDSLTCPAVVGPAKLVSAVAYGATCDNGADPNEAALAAAIGDAVANYNNEYNKYVAAGTALAEAELRQLSPAKNLISAQDAGDGSFPPPHFYPNLNSGDFTAFMLIDGENENDGIVHDEKTIMPPPVGSLDFSGYATSQALYGGHYLRSVDAITALLMHQSAVNEWANNPNTGATTDLVFTAPTKSFYSDWAYTYRYEPHLDLISPLANNILAHFNTGWPPFHEQFGPDGSACDLVGITPWDRDEQRPGTPVSPSPALFKSFCTETNLLYTGDESVFGTFLGEWLDVNSINSLEPQDKGNGWVNVRLDQEATAYHPAFDLFNSTAMVIGHDGGTVLLDEPDYGNGADHWVQLGMPYIGFSYKQRDFQQAPQGYGGLTDHSYRRGFREANELGGLPWCDFLPCS